MRGGNPTPASVILAQLERRFPRDRRRAPTKADMRILRELLTAAGGDVEELANWAEAVRDTDDDSAACSAHLARVEYRALMAARAEKALAAAQERKQSQILQNFLREEPKRPGPRRDRFIEIDTQIVRVAEELAPRGPETSVKALISEAVRRVNAVLTAFPAGDIGDDALICTAVSAVWQPLAPGAQPAATQWNLALGQREEAAVARIFARLRRRRVKGWRGTLPADFGWSYLAGRIQPRRRGVRKFGRPRSNSDPN